MPAPLRPVVIQGGMGVAVSSWQLASTVARTGQLGVVSGTALDIVLARRLQDGDPGGHARRALAQFPRPDVAEWVLDRYFRPDGRPAAVSYAPVRQAGPDRSQQGPRARGGRQLRRGVPGQGGPRRPGRGQLPREGAAGDAVRGAGRHAGRRRLRADGGRTAPGHPAAARRAARRDGRARPASTSTARRRSTGSRVRPGGVVGRAPASSRVPRDHLLGHPGGLPRAGGADPARRLRRRGPDRRWP